MYFSDVLRNPALAVGIPVLLGSASGLVTRSSHKTWYTTLKKPKFEPKERAIFPVVWTVLYAGMGYASHLVINAFDRSPSKDVRKSAKLALTLYAAQLGLNLAWTPLFFGARKPGFALVDISILTPLVYGLTGLLYKVDRQAFNLFLPYCAWLGFATYLNAGVWWLNGGEDRYLEIKGKKKGDNRPRELSKDL